MHRPFLPCLLLAACLPAIPEDRPGAMIEEPPAPEGGGEPPRRRRMDQWVPAERAIYDALQAVEEVGAHVLLTDAVVLLNRAQDKVADYVDGIASPPELDAEPFVPRVGDQYLLPNGDWATVTERDEDLLTAPALVEPDPKIGDQLLYRVGGTDEAPELRPALVVKSWGGSAANLQVFVDGSNDRNRTVTYVHGATTETYSLFDAAQIEHGIAWKTSVPRGTAIGQWRWPAQA